LREVAAQVSLPGPSNEEFSRLLSDIARDLSRVRHVEISLTTEERATLVNHLSGLTLMEAEKVLTKALVEDGALTPHDIAHVLEAKRRIVEREGLLEYYPAEHALAEVADLAGLKGVARQAHRGRAGSGAGPGVRADVPQGRAPARRARVREELVREGRRGGMGAAAAQARSLESLQQVHRRERAELQARRPGRRAHGPGGALGRRAREGVRLRWWRGRRRDAASAGELPFLDAGPHRRRLRRGDRERRQRASPEFLRKGRFDEIFFVDLPDRAVREEIFRIHLARRNRDATDLDLGTLSAHTEGFSGSEIEEVVVAGLYTAFAAGTPLDTATLAREVAATRPLAVTMREKIDAMRAWAADRAVRAN
jgi:hypothetical protein